MSKKLEISTEKCAVTFNPTKVVSAYYDNSNRVFVTSEVPDDTSGVENFKFPDSKSAKEAYDSFSQNLTDFYSGKWEFNDEPAVMDMAGHMSYMRKKEGH